MSNSNDPANPAADPNSELQNLLPALVEGTITDEQFQTLGKLLIGNPRAQEEYREYVELHAMLQFEHQPQVPIVPDLGTDPSFSDALPSAPISASNFPGTSQFWFGGGWQSIGFLALAIVAGIAVAEGWLLYRDRGQPRGAVKNEMAENVLPQAMPAAFLTVDNGAIWGGDRPAIRNVGSAVQLGDEIALSEGIAEFRLSSGVYLSLEGPASVVLVSPSTLMLQYGKLTAHVPWTVTDFKAIASACRLTACDAEFGVSHEGSKIEVHAFAGEVRAESPRAVRDAITTDISEGGSVVVDDAGVFTKGTITEGNALGLVADGEVLKVQSVGGKAEPSKFAMKLPMAGALVASKAYVDAVMETKPVDYWRFESFKDGVVPNEVPGGMSLKVVGDLRLTGRVDNSAIEFQPGASSYLVSPPFDSLAGKDYSVECWLKPSHVHRGGVLALTTTDDVQNHAFYIELQGPRNQVGGGPYSSKYPGTIRFLQRDPPGGDPLTGSSCFSKKPYAVRRWQYVVAVNRDKELRLYVNGSLVSTTPDVASLAPHLQLILGRMETFTKDRKFVGQLDEVAIYDYGLSSRQIKSHYQAVQWRPGQKEAPRDDDA